MAMFDPTAVKLRTSSASSSDIKKRRTCLYRNTIGDSSDRFFVHEKQRFFTRLITIRFFAIIFRFKFESKRTLILTLLLTAMSEEIPEFAKVNLRQTGNKPDEEAAEDLGALRMASSGSIANKKKLDFKNRSRSSAPVGGFLLGKDISVYPNILLP